MCIGGCVCGYLCLCVCCSWVRVYLCPFMSVPICRYKSVACGMSKCAVSLQSCCLLVRSVCLWWFGIYLHRIRIYVILIPRCLWLQTPLSGCVILDTHFYGCLSGRGPLSYTGYSMPVFSSEDPNRVSALFSLSFLPPHPCLPFSLHLFPSSSGSGTQGGPPPGPGGIKQDPSAPTSCPTT